MRTEWRKSSFSGAGQADCVEIAYSATVRVRDSKNPTGGTLHFPANAWFPARLTRSEWPNAMRPNTIA